MNGRRVAAGAAAVRRKAVAGLRQQLVTNPIIRWAYEPAGGSLPLPPPALMRLVQNSPDPAWFTFGGTLATDDIRTLLIRNGLRLEGFERILDFGCGVGRVLRHWHGTVPGEIHGTDYNEALVAWCRGHLPFRVVRNGLDPPLSYADSYFDFIYAFSVFTHLDKQRQLRWMTELIRVTQPGGHLLITTQGTRHLRLLDDAERTALSAGELVVQRAELAGRNRCLAFHPESWVRAHLAGEMEIVDYAPWGAAGLVGQDMYLLRKPPS